MTGYVRGGRVLIRTLPLGRNYGGLLQAYALQTVIRRLGHDVDTDDSQVPTLTGRFVRPYLAIKPAIWKRPLHMREVRVLADADLLDFVRSRLSTVSLYSMTRRPRRSVVNRYATFVVGSDQVWRPVYSDIPSSLFNFLPDDFAGKRLSYAASFGGADPSEYSAELRAATREFALRLDAVSVREESGTRLVRQLWGRRDAVQHVDPTLLLVREDYESLIRRSSSRAGTPEPGGVVSYILDAAATKTQAGESIATQLGVGMQSILRPEPATIRAYLAEPETFRKIPVGSWLGAIRDAKFVLTDSFHGCAFSILFNTPFAVLPNAERGMARLESLLRMFDLEDRIIPNSGQALSIARIAELVDSRMDWAKIDKRLEQERGRARAYLEQHL